jgi:hypothetical protein
MIFVDSLLLIGSSAVHYRFGPTVGRAGQERASDWPIRAPWSSFSFRLKVGTGRYKQDRYHTPSMSENAVKD